MADSYDIIIVGGGTAGLVLAARLSEDPALQVAIVEAGEDQTANPQVLTPGMWPLLANTPVDWAFPTAPQELGKKDLILAQGRALGGSSSINSFLFTPTSKSNVEAWAKLGNAGWDWSAFSKSLEKSYTLHGFDGAVRGQGPLELNTSDPEAKWTKIWTDTIGSLGFPVNDPFTGEVLGSLILPESIDPGKKQRSSSANTYLAAARKRDNVTVLPGTAVSKLVLNSDADKVVAEGVQFIKDGETKTIKARKEVILAAGPVNSPRLLELSGIGGAELLRSHGIDVVIDNPHIGENLQNHVVTGVTFEVRDHLETLDPVLRQEPAALGAAMQAYSKGTGPLGTSNTIASARLPLPQAIPDLDALIQSRGDDVRGTPEFAAAHEAYVRSVLENAKEPSAIYIAAPAYAPIDSDDPKSRPPGNHYTVGLLLAHPLSRGSVHITSGSAENASGSKGLAIDPRYLSHPLDVEVLAQHIRYIEQSIGKAEPFASQLKPRDSRFASLEAAREYVKKTAKGAHHYTGTCSLMPRALGGVVDEKLRVYGTANLRVCDSSIIPLMPSANPQATVYGVAELGATLIKETL